MLRFALTSVLPGTLTGSMISSHRGQYSMPDWADTLPDSTVPTPVSTLESGAVGAAEPHADRTTDPPRTVRTPASHGDLPSEIVLMVPLTRGTVRSYWT